ncbi:hypothetical protein GCM10009536_01560 [Streptomyces thermocarboxydus]
MPGAIADLMADLSAISKLLQVLCNKISDDVYRTGSAHMAAPGGRGLDSFDATPGPEARSSAPARLPWAIAAKVVRVGADGWGGPPDVARSVPLKALGRDESAAIRVMADGAEERARVLRPGDGGVGWGSSAIRAERGERVAATREFAAEGWGRAPHARSAAPSFVMRRSGSR